METVDIYTDGCWFGNHVHVKNVEECEINVFNTYFYPQGVFSWYTQTVFVVDEAKSHSAIELTIHLHSNV